MGDTELNSEWNGFGFREIQESDYPSVFASLQSSFYLDEPIQRFFGITEDRKKDLDVRYRDIMDLGGGSFFAFPLDEPEKVAAVCILWIHEKGVDLPTREYFSSLTATVRHAVGQVKQVDVYEKRSLDKYSEILIISTGREFRGKGLATEMFRRSIRKFRGDGYLFVYSVFTNPYSRKIGERLGFKEISRRYFSELKNKDGSLLMGDAGKGHFGQEAILDL